MMKDEVLARLVASKAAREVRNKRDREQTEAGINPAEAHGRDCGRRWAEQHAEYDDLRRIANQPPMYPPSPSVLLTLTGAVGWAALFGTGTAADYDQPTAASAFTAAAREVWDTYKDHPALRG